MRWSLIPAALICLAARPRPIDLRDCIGRAFFEEQIGTIGWCQQVCVTGWPWEASLCGEPVVCEHEGAMGLVVLDFTTHEALDLIDARTTTPEEVTRICGH